MEAPSVDTRIKSEPDFIKQEPGIRIKSEFEPSLSSLPMAPVKKEDFKLDVKPDVKPVRNLDRATPCTLICGSSRNAY